MTRAGLRTLTGNSVADVARDAVAVSFSGTLLSAVQPLLRLVKRSCQN